MTPGAWAAGPCRSRTPVHDHCQGRLFIPTGQAAPHPGHRSALSPYRRANDLSPGVGPRPSYAQKVIAVTLAVLGRGHGRPLIGRRRYFLAVGEVANVRYPNPSPTQPGRLHAAYPDPPGQGGAKGRRSPRATVLFYPLLARQNRVVRSLACHPSDKRGKLGSARPSSAWRWLCRQAPPTARSGPSAAGIRTRSPNRSRWPLC